MLAKAAVASLASNADASELAPGRLFAFFEGAWTLERAIRDAHEPLRTASGVASFVASGQHELAYEEDVRVSGFSREMRATRAYRYRFAEAAIVVEFADGSPFYTMPLAHDASGTALHLCGPDRYEATFRMIDAWTWTLDWKIGGAKSLAIATIFTRAR